MAYREVACSSLSQVPALVAAFAVELGWTAIDPGLPQPARDFRRPIEPDPNGGAPDADIRSTHAIRVLATLRDNGPTGPASMGGDWPETNIHELQITGSDDEHEYLKARVPSPWWYGGDQRQPLIPLPTKLHLFGQGLPEPFIHCVIEYRFNVYRHLYIGSLNRTGAQSVCDVVSSTQGINQRWSLNYNYSYMAWGGLFSGADWNASAGQLTRRNGGIILADGFKNFQIFSASGSPRVSDNGRSNVVFGGARDGMNDTLISHGFSPFSGENFLSPVNLFTVGGAFGTERRVIPLGSVRGVRNVNMRNLEPGAAIVVGNKRWRVFPQLSKQEDSVTRPGPRSPSEGVSSNWNGYAAGDTSHFWGVALLEGDA